ncbi:hypothetical protein F5X71_28355 [Nocardia brasiliensis]|uniref:DUF8020 domain-containing protein n=2 Tax=Nocardia brasiliensis TaxID=37326 RepID=A0A6G9Y3F1_NOCBR|nr:hypothetical protein F5X71_28355 [Nocardia brasiliensis]
MVAALAGSAATGHAETEARQMRYTASAVEKSVVLTTDIGALRAADGHFEVRDPAGRLVVSMPLSYQNAGRVWPITAEIDGRTARLTPSTDPASARPAPAEVRDIAIDPQSTDFNTAVMNFATVAGLGVALGTLIGTTIGAAIGCVAGGALVGAATAVPTIGVLAVPGFLGGCLVTGAAAAPIGAIIGTIALGVPAAVIGGLLFADALGRQAAS